jgi:hypothetical protein
LEDHLGLADAVIGHAKVHRAGNGAGVLVQRGINVAPELTRDQRLGIFTGLIVEGPDSWPVRPVAEVNYQRAFSTDEETSILVGAIWKLKEKLALDLGFRHAWVNRRPDEQVRAGITFDLS